MIREGNRSGQVPTSGRTALALFELGNTDTNHAKKTVDGNESDLECTLPMLPAIATCALGERGQAPLFPCAIYFASSKKSSDHVLSSGSWKPNNHCTDGNRQNIVAS